MQKTSETLPLFDPQTLQELTLSPSDRLAKISALLEEKKVLKETKVALSRTQLPSLLTSDQVFFCGKMLREHSPHAGADFWKIIQAFANIGGYRLEFQLLNTKWLLPQNRERIYLIGHLTEKSFPGVFPIGENDKLPKGKTRKENRKSTSIKTSLARTITARYSKMGSNDTYIIPKVAATLTGGGHSGGLHSDMTIIQINPSTESNGRQPYQQNRVFDEKGISPALTRHNSDFIIKQRSRGKNKGANLKICPTISSNAFQEKNLLDGVRRLTEIECERLQGFPDNWTQYGDYNGIIKPIAKTQRYKLIGNAVTVDIVELIAKRLKITKQ